MANINSFTCDKQLSKYASSLLFDSGTVIAELDMTGACDYRAVVILKINGEVKVRRKDSNGEWLTTPSKFPEEISEAIKADKWDDLDVDVCGDWFALAYSLYSADGEEIFRGDDICRINPSALTPDDVRTYLTERGERYIDRFIKNNSAKNSTITMTETKERFYAIYSTFDMNM